MVSWAQEEGLVAWNGMVLTWDPSQTDMAIPKISQWWPSFDPRIVSWAEEGGWWPEMDAATQPSRLQTFTRSPPSLPPFVNFISFHISHDGGKGSKKKYEQILTRDSLFDTGHIQKGWGQNAKLGPHSAIWGKLGTALQAYALNPCTKFPPNPTSRKVNT